MAEEKEILLKLKRKFSKDEAVKALMLEIGMLKSELAEAQFNVEKLTAENKSMRNIIRKHEVKFNQIALDNNYQRVLSPLHEENTALLRKIKQKDKEIRELINQLVIAKNDKKITSHV